MERLFGRLAFCLIFGKGAFVFGENMDEKVNLFEGDIAGFAPGLRHHDPGFKGDPRFAQSQWPDNTIPYEFDSQFPSELIPLFEQATQHIQDRTCIKFKPHEGEHDYVRVFSGRGCYSWVGRSGGAQDMSLPYGCDILGINVHELLHAVGFHHEQSREDRDQYVVVNWGNIESGMEHNFEKERSSLQLPYDYSSILHYDRNAFSWNGGETITPNDAAAQIGQRGGMSDGDTEEVNKLFCGGRKK